MDIKAVAYYQSPVSGKFALPRQAGVAPSLTGRIVLDPSLAREEALRGLEGFDYLWLIWGFNLNRPSASGHARLTVRPPRLGGNTRVGVFASRSPFRPNPIGLSCVRIVNVLSAEGVIEVSGGDLADGTPIFDIKPYVTYADSHPEARSGFVDGNDWHTLPVEWEDGAEDSLKSDGLNDADINALTEILSQDPRPQYQDDPGKRYGFDYKGCDIHFRVDGDKLRVLGKK